MGKIGFFGGSFNPPTKAHIELGKKIVKELNLDKLIFVPIGNFYQKSELIDYCYRYEMLKIICNNNKNLEVSDIENNQNNTLYAIDVFEMIRKKYPNDDIYFVMGTDNLKKIKYWKGYIDLVSKYKYIILERANNEFNNILSNYEEIKNNVDNFILLSEKKYMKISSSIIRDKIKRREEVEDFIPREIINYIKENDLYKK